MMSLNKNDCLTCAIATARGVSYKTIFYSIRMLGTFVNYNDKELAGMRRISKFSAIFTKKPLVLCYSTGPGKGHAVAVINGECVDNCSNSKNENRSVLWMCKNHDVTCIFKAKG